MNQDLSDFVSRPLNFSAFFLHFVCFTDINNVVCPMIDMSDLRITEY